MMAVISTVLVSQLDDGWILAPERYDPRRWHPSTGAKTLDLFVRTVRDLISPAKINPDRQYLVLDTGDAQRGILRSARQPGPPSELGSTKKRIGAGHVVISRLRPYLRQVAWVDPRFCPDDVDVVCSTEFFVLESVDGESIAFLVPFLLSEPVQEVLAAAQEGGHHPRVNEATLLRIEIPDSVIEARSETSARIESAIRSIRNGLTALEGLETAAIC